METFELDIYSKLGEKDGWVVDESFLVMYFSAYLLLSCVGQSLCEDAGIGYGESRHNAVWLLGKDPIVGLAKEFVLIVLGFLAEELVDRIPTTVEGFQVEPWCSLWQEVEIFERHLTPSLR